MNNFIFIIIILLLILFIIFYKNKKKKEHFIADIYNEPILKLNVIDTKIPEITIYKNEYDTSIKFDSLNRFDKSILIKSVDDFDLIEKKPYNLYYTDVYTFNKYYKKDYKEVCNERNKLQLAMEKKGWNKDLRKEFDKYKSFYQKYSDMVEELDKHKK